MYSNLLTIEKWLFLYGGHFDVELLFDVVFIRLLIGGFKFFEISDWWRFCFPCCILHYIFIFICSKA